MTGRRLQTLEIDGVTLRVGAAACALALVIAASPLFLHLWSQTFLPAPARAAGWVLLLALVPAMASITARTVASAPTGWSALLCGARVHGAAALAAGVATVVFAWVSEMGERSPRFYLRGEAVALATVCALQWTVGTASASLVRALARLLGSSGRDPQGGRLDWTAARNVDRQAALSMTAVACCLASVLPLAGFWALIAPRIFDDPDEMVTGIAAFALAPVATSVLGALVMARLVARPRPAAEAFALAAIVQVSAAAVSLLLGGFLQSSVGLLSGDPWEVAVGRASYQVFLLGRIQLVAQVFLGGVGFCVFWVAAGRIVERSAFASPRS